ncbi:MAG TPA: ribosome biogenesis GTPase Der [bacterium]|nr:ribosome biogenesis GTPase Der [bacterium]
MLPIVTIVGRPNVGKSSLFNALAGGRLAIVSDEANTTRDIVERVIHDEAGNARAILRDSGGLTYGSRDEILSDIRERVERSVRESDLVVFVVEYDKVSQEDEFVARQLRQADVPVVLVANKADNMDRSLEAYGAMSLGFEDFAVTSANHRRGIDTLREKIFSRFPYETPDEDESTESSPLRLAIIGRPNVGKSSLLNALTGENRAMVRDMPGTTRDTVDTLVSHAGREITLIDTAGIRRAGKIGMHNIESWSVLRSKEALARADVVAVVIDADEGVTHLDQAILGDAVEAKKGIILVMNKWDLFLKKPEVDPSSAQDRYMAFLKNRLDFAPYAVPVFTSAAEGKRIPAILDAALGIETERKKRIKTATFNTFIEQIVLKHAPTGNKKSHKPKVYYGSQVDVDPPKFVIHVNRADHFHFSYPRYIENQIREFFGFYGTPITVELRGRRRDDVDGPDEDRDSFQAMLAAKIAKARKGPIDRRRRLKKKHG